MNKIIILLFCLNICLKGFSQNNVGIGITNPTEKLHVSGNIKADTIKPSAVKFTPDAGNGKVLTSDAAGNASWKEASLGGVGYGAWGGCDVTGINEYNPVADDSVAANDFFGITEAISGNFAIIGAYGDDIGSNANQGSASIYKYDGANWVLFKKLTDATGLAGDNFGFSVAISGNYAVVGAYGDDVGANVNQGSVSVYQYNGTDWVFKQRLIDPVGLADDQFGYSVSISGSYIAIGAPNGNATGSLAVADCGTASIFKFDGSNWVFMQKIFDDPAALIGDEFGYSISISGEDLFVGAPSDDGTFADQGSVSVFRFNGSTWQQTAKLINAAGAASDLFGRSVSVNGSYVAIGEPNNNTGIAHIYRYSTSGWSFMQSLTETTGNNFGNRVSLSKNYILVGSASETVGSNNTQGATYLYVRVGGMWQKIQRITDPAGTANANFGLSLAVDGDTKRFVIGAYRAAPGGKAIFGKIN